ncbi:muscarinic acetylcholine receptor M3-like [Ruditapes philippinarum]|uniref:muscarinic acetylcholine receptor M3-like n=1 Tax=Ruditapes philippinarum TaxID=129788 RepID=UPI00295B996D|nr:muscarinic acetylcholine receptor M3-like [Ruditapes philippinarum]
MLLGIVGNVHVLLVYLFRMKKATSHRIFIIALAILDLTSCLVSMPFIIADMFLRLTFNSSITCRIFRFLLYFFAGSSGFVLLPIAIDRYLKTCRPFGQQIDPQRAKKLCAFVLMFCIFSFWPIPVLYGETTVITHNPNITGVSCYIDDAYKDTFYLTYWNGLMLIMAIVMVFCLVILYCMIGKSIRHHVKAKNKLLIKEDKHLKVPKAKSTLAHSTTNGKIGKRKNIDRNNAIVQVDLKAYTIYNGINTNTNHSCGSTHIAESDTELSVTGEESKTDYTNENVTLNNINIMIPTDMDSLNDTNHSYEGNEQENQNIDKNKEEKMDTHSEKKAVEKEHDSKNLEINLARNLDQTVNTGNSLESTESNGQTPVGRENSRKRKEALRNLKRSKRTTQMFFAITILYFLTFIPHLILQVITLTTENFVSSLSFAWQTIYHIVFYCSFLNSTINCYVYGFFDTMFRDELRKIYSLKCCKKRRAR